MSLPDDYSSEKYSVYRTLPDDSEVDHNIELISTFGKCMDKIVYSLIVDPKNNRILKKAKTFNPLCPMSDEQALGIYNVIKITGEALKSEPNQTRRTDFIIGVANIKKIMKNKPLEQLLSKNKFVENYQQTSDAKLIR